MFQDRKDAGVKLAKALTEYKNKSVLVLAIPHGGVEVGYQVAKYLNADFSVIIARKLPFPDNKEAGFGAIAEDGSIFILEEFKDWLKDEIVQEIKEKQRNEIEKRKQALRNNQPLPEIKDRVVILVDDGIAMGSTMRVSIILCRNRGAKKIIVASPVAGREVSAQIEKCADKTVILEKPVFFQAVAESYRNWYDVSSSEVKKILEKT